MKRKSMLITMAITMGLIICSENTIAVAEGSLLNKAAEYSETGEYSEDEEYSDSDESAIEVNLPQNSDDVIDEVTRFADEYKIKKLKKLLKKFPAIQKKAEKEIDMDNLWYVENKNHLTASYDYAITNDDDFDYYYTGPLKKNKPDGIGILWHSFENCEYLEDGEKKYIGELKKGRFKGIGLELGEYSEMYDGIVDYYFGEFKDSRKSGFGLDVIGDVYVCGEFKKGYPNGEVVEYYKDLLVYEGGMKDGDFSGKGTTYYEDGTVEYKGEFKKGKYHGKGTFYDEDGNKVYSGKWKNGDYAS